MQTVTVIFQKFYKEILTALALITIGAILSQGVTESYDPFEAKAKDVNSMMQETLNNPTAFNLGTAQDELFYTYYPWAERQTSGDKKLFIDYLEACNQVIIQESQGVEPDTAEMNRLYTSLTD